MSLPATSKRYKMKKLFYTMGLFLLMASCSNDYTDWANPQSNHEDPATVSLTIQPAEAIDFAKLTTDSVQLFTPVVKAAEGSVNTYTVVLYKADKSDSKALKADALGKVKSAELEEAVLQLFGHRPVARTIDLDVTAFTIIEGQSIKNQASTKAIITPEAPIIENAYYLVGSINGWDNNNKDFPVVNSEADVYKDPVFTITLTAAQVGNGVEFKLNPVSGIGSWDKCYTASKDEAEGKIAGGNAGGNLKVEAVENAKYYKLEFNMLDLTFKVTPMSDPELYLTGNHYDWGKTWKQLVPVYGTTDLFWTIVYLHAGEQFKFAPQADWGNDFGMQATIHDEANAGVSDTDGNITIANAGWYQLTVTNGASRSVTISKPKVYLIGNTVGSWGIEDANLFTEPTTEDGVFVSKAFAKADEVRMCVSVPGHDWWQSEFIVTAKGKIDYRGKGGDQTRVNVKAGQKAYLNFSKGTGKYQ